MPAPIDILITRRLTLRPPLEVDAEALARGLGDFDVASRLSRVPHPYGLQDAVDWIASKQEEPGLCDFTVHREKLIGAVSVHQRHDHPTLGYWFAKPAALGRDVDDIRTSVTRDKFERLFGSLDAKQAA